MGSGDIDDTEDDDVATEGGDDEPSELGVLRYPLEAEEEGLDGSRAGTPSVCGACWLWGWWMADMRCPCEDSATADRLSWCDRRSSSVTPS